MAQPCPQIIEHLIRDVNPKWFHYNDPRLAIASGQLDAQAISHGASPISVDRRNNQGKPYILGLNAEALRPKKGKQRKQNRTFHNAQLPLDMLHPRAAMSMCTETAR